MKKWTPWILAAIFAAWFLSGFQAPKPKNSFDIAGFGRLPVLLDGRIQPLDSVARNSRLSMSGVSVVHRSNAPSLSATEWLLDTMTKPALADTFKIFRVEHPDLAGLFGTENLGTEFGFFSFNDITNQFDQLQTQSQNLTAEEQGKSDAVKLRTPSKGT